MTLISFGSVLRALPKPLHCHQQNRQFVTAQKSDQLEADCLLKPVMTANESLGRYQVRDHAERIAFGLARIARGPYVDFDQSGSETTLAAT